MCIRLHVDTKGSWAFHGTPLGRTGSQASEVIAMDTGSVPPPPIPPPPPPPPPPLPTPAASFSKLGSARQLRLRNLNWECIPKERVEGRRSVWSDSFSSDDDDFPIDLRSLDELFGRKEGRKPDRADSLYRSLRQSRSLQDTAADKVSLLDSKRSMNVGIFLRQFKIEVREIVADVRQGGGERYGAEKLTELCKLLPDSEEEARLKRFNGEHSLLREPDLFMLLLVEVPNFRLRVDAMILRQEFDPAVTSLCVAARCLGEAARELLSCHKLHSILRLVLKAGNYMNAGGYAGNAAGFRITSLLRLADTKANKPGMNLLHFVAMEAVKKDEDLLTFPSHLSHVSSASRLSEESVLEDLSRLRSRVAALRVSTRAEAEIEPQTRPFLEVADVRLKEAQEEVNGLRKTSQALMEFFCEDENSFKLEEACRIFHCFCHRFQRAVRENVEREQQELRRAEREREREKLRSLVVCSGLDEPDDLERTLTRSLSCTWSRRSLRRHTQQVPNFKEKRPDSNFQQPIQSAGPDLSQALGSEGCNRSSVPSKHVLIKDCNDDYGLDSPEETDITKKVGSRKASPLTLESPVLKVEAQVHITSEKLTHIMPDNLMEAEKLGCMDSAEASPPQLLSEPGVALQVDTEAASRPVAELWLGSCLPKVMPQLTQELKPACPDRACIYPRLGESVECHTLVKGLRSYEAFSPGGTRPAPSHCSKWRKELHAGERDRSSSPQPKEDLQARKALARNPTKRGLATRSGLSSSTSIPKVRAKVELGLVDGPTTARTPRFSPACSSSTRSSTSTRPTGMQNELKRTSSIRDKAGSLVHQLGRQERQPVEKAARAKDAVLPGHEPFIRGSPLRVSKRLAPISEAQSLCQPRAGHSPTAKTIRTAVINAAKNKTSKNAETASPPKPMTGTRSAGPKIPRPTTQPMWR